MPQEENLGQDLRQFVEQVASGEITSKTKKEFEELQAKAKKILAAKPKKATKTKTKAKTKSTPKSDKQILLRNTKDRKDSNDKLSQIFFKPDVSQAKRNGGYIVNGKVKTSKVKNEILWKFDKEFLDANPRLLDFTAFDKEVILACISEHVTHLENKDYESSYTTTLDSIYRAIVGDDGEGKNEKRPSPAMLEKIKESIRKASFCRIHIDLTESCRKYGYNDGKPLKLETYILPCKFLDGYIVNGKPTTVIKFYEVSALYQSAEVQNGQILNYDKKLLAIPNVNNSDEVIALKGYLLRRVLEILAHKMTPTILLDTVFHDTGFSDLTRDKKRKLLAHIEKFFEYWLSEKRLKSYFFVDRKGNKLKGAKWQKGEIYRPTPKKANLGIHAIKFT